jgi:predicted negative regulator of RcsB-dependent stress response
MEEPKKQPVNNKQSPGPQDLSDLFVTDVPKPDPQARGAAPALTEKDVFTANNFKNASSPTSSPSGDLLEITPTKSSPSFLNKISTIQKLLIAGIVAIAALLVYLLTAQQKYTTQIPPYDQSTTKQVIKEDHNLQTPSKTLEQFLPENSPQTTKLQHVQNLNQNQPLSMQAANDLYLKQEYENAYQIYELLSRELATTENARLIRDLLELRMAFCILARLTPPTELTETQKQTSQEKVSQLLKKAQQSRSPAIKSVACYQDALIAIRKKQYLLARKKAFQALVLLDAIKSQKKWVSEIRAHCQFLTAEAITRYTVNLLKTHTIPQRLWDKGFRTDPFVHLSQTPLRTLINSGTNHFDYAMIGPIIKKQDDYSDNTNKYYAASYRASIEEILIEYANLTDSDIRWPVITSPKDQNQHDNLDKYATRAIRKRPVSFCMKSTTPKQLVMTSAGCAGLAAKIDRNNNVIISDPENYTSLAEHIDALSTEAISIWRKFAIMFQQDKYVPNALFAVALLQSQNNEVTNAIAQYKLLVTQFPQAAMAPFALMKSSILKAKIKDLPGAQRDLTQLVEQYPDFEFFADACLQLADITMQNESFDHAARIYKKVYNSDFSQDSRAIAALGAGRAFYAHNDLQNAILWLSRYIEVTRNKPTDQVYLAYHLLGKTYLELGKNDPACEALKYALSSKLDKSDYITVLTTLADVHVRKQNFFEAIELLESVPSWKFSAEEYTEVLIIKATVYRAMGLVEKAMAALIDRAKYTANNQLKTRILLEINKCHIAKGELETARRNLADLLATAQPGPLTNDVALELANINLILNNDQQVIEICHKLLETQPSKEIKRKTQDLIAAAYSRQGNYDKAVLALLGQKQEKENNTAQN